MWSRRHHFGPSPARAHGVQQDHVSTCTPGIRYRRQLPLSSPSSLTTNSGRRSSFTSGRLVALCLLISSCISMSNDVHGSAFGFGADAASSPLPSSVASSASSPFESETLSPRTVNTKYGSLRGLLVSFRMNDAASRYAVPAASSSASRTAAASSSSSPSAASSSSVSSSGVTNLRPVEVFVGVPYATPPIGSLRFMPPVTPTHWRGVRLATRFPAVCPQKLPDFDFKSTSTSTGSMAKSSPSAASGRSSTSSKPAFSFTPNSYASLTSLSSSSSSSSSSDQVPESRISHLKRVSAFLRNQSEDCLYLNVYAPFTSPSLSQPSSSSSQRKCSFHEIFVLMIIMMSNLKLFLVQWSKSLSTGSIWSQIFCCLPDFFSHCIENQCSVCRTVFLFPSQRPFMNDTFCSNEL